MSTPEENPAWSGGVTVSREMKDICKKKGFLRSFHGGQRLRTLFRAESGNWDCEKLSPFGKACFFGALDRVVLMYAMSGIDLKGHESGFNHGYASLVVLGAQRIMAHPGGPSLEHVDTLKFLLGAGAPADVQDICGHTALHHACQMGVRNKELVLELIRVLFDNGANVNHQNRYGEVALFLCFKSNNVQALEILMEHNADTNIPEADGITPAAFYSRCGPKVEAVMARWIRKRKGEEELPRQGKKCCDCCGKEDVPLKNCGRCQVARYCSVECQKKVWSAHKKKCQPFSTVNTVTLKPFYQEGMHFIPVSDKVRAAMGYAESEIPERNLRGSHIPKVDEPKNLIIKVQIPAIYTPEGAKPAGTKDGDLAIYTKKRDLACMVRKVDQADGGAPYDKLVQVIKTKGVRGLKAYFAAELKNKDELVIKISEVLAEQPF
ncbi:hypothetical protein K435DRAFT_864196 [Dendrothele bispora CBS 962.96]|uniref:MYND-type domain-containing protein n=1 Tax=Dendrothele bispora (strain CBS 962.96) TaxID=1314807 RepID=A0A4S8LML5_DENBC|nr:hypothetical protein K435DRAFT_864196 [Dendrothele bispora CBS 962.96]